jgi:hypothetical protein
VGVLRGVFSLTMEIDSSGAARKPPGGAEQVPVLPGAETQVSGSAVPEALPRD